jgi:nucleoside-diphosphate-sugar epimerase
MGPSQRPVVEPEDTFDNPIEVGGEVHRASVSAVFHAAAVSELPNETLQVDLEGARQLLDAAAEHQPPGRRILTADPQPGCGYPAHHAIPVGRVVTVTRAQLMDVEVARAGIRERL